MTSRGGWNRNDRWESFPTSKPIAVEGGLATSRERGAIAESWWSKRFIAVLESFGLGGRMQRGRKYARSGQVVSLDVTAGLIKSRVQGSRPAPYVVTIKVAAPTDTQWAELDEAMQRRVGFAAQLLAGDVPPELEAAFDTAGVALFPRSWREVDSQCTCPDYENPCKHIAAALYLFADQLDADPWLLLTWRGRSREQVLSHIGPGPRAEGAADAAAAVAPWWPLVPGTVSNPDQNPERTGSSRTPTQGDLFIPVGDPPNDPASVLARLGELTTSAGTPTGFATYMTALYQQLV